MRYSFLLLITAATSTDALAGKCDYLVARAESSSGATLISNYQRLIDCDAAEAQANFTAFMKQATDSDTLVDLSLTAIDADVWNPVWEMIGKISDYEARDEVAQRVGEACVERDKVVGFLQGAYFGLRDIEFQQWDNALTACQSESFESWMLQQVQSPPDKQFDEKWNTLARAFVKLNGSAALPILTAAAISAAEAGPFESILTIMEESISPGFGSPSPEDQAALNAGLIQIAEQVPPTSARSIADRLLNAGDEASAAALMPSIYPDAVQSGGGFLYGAVSVEACEDDQSAVIHAAVVLEPGERYLLQGGVADEAMRAFKSRQKCDVTEPWTVVTSPEPLNSAGDLDVWVAGIQAQWEERGYSVKLRDEKDVSL